MEILLTENTCSQHKYWPWGRANTVWMECHRLEWRLAVSLIEVEIAASYPVYGNVCYVQKVLMKK